MGICLLNRSGCVQDGSDSNERVGIVVDMSEGQSVCLDGFGRKVQYHLLMLYSSASLTYCKEIGDRP